MNATDIINALEAAGFPVEWEDTGGGVYNVVAEVISHPTGVVGTVQISDNGDWGMGDEDTFAGVVSVIGYDRGGDSVVDERSQDLIYASTLDEVMALAIDMADAVRSTYHGTTISAPPVTGSGEPDDLVYARCLVCGYSTDDETTLELWNGYGDHIGPWTEACTDHSLWVLRDGSVVVINGDERHEIGSPTTTTNA
jgi:hypothetical protein